MERVLESDSHQYVGTCAVSFEFRSGDESLSSCNTRIVRFNGADGKVLSCDDAGPSSILARKELFLNDAFNFHRTYTLPGFINFNLQYRKTYTWGGSTWESKIYNFVYIGE